MMNLGIIGFGNAAQAFTKGLLASSHMRVGSLRITERTQEKKDMAKDLFGLEAFSNNVDLAEWSDYILLAVKPINYPEVLAEIKDHLKGKVLISFIVGTSHEELSKHLVPGTAVVRIMPNIAMAVREALCTAWRNDQVSDEQFETVLNMYRKVGEVLVVDEPTMEKVAAVSAAGLGFVAYWMAALEKATVALGIDPKEAEIIAVQTFKGAVHTVGETDFSPTDLQNSVATKGGTTIEGLMLMEERGVTQAISDGVNATYQKGLSFSKKK